MDGQAKINDISNYDDFSTSEKEIKKIKRGNGNAVATFYNNHIKAIKGICKNFYLRNYERLKGLICLDDLFNQVYVDLPLYNYTDRTHIYYCILGSCRYVLDGGISFILGKGNSGKKSVNTISLNTPVYTNKNGEEITREYTLADVDFFKRREEQENREEQEEKSENFYKFIKKLLKTKKQKDDLKTLLFA